MDWWSRPVRRQRILTAGFTVLVVGLCSVVGYRLHATSLAAVPEIAVRAPYATGVPVPATGVYIGSTVVHDTHTVPGSCTDAAQNTAAQQALLECKVRWAAQQQGMDVPAGWGLTAQHIYNQCDRPLGSDITIAAKNASRKLLLISMPCGDYGPLASGDAALLAAIRSRVAEIKALGLPVILVYMHEPESSSCGRPGGGKGTPEEYRAAYRRFANTVRVEAARLDAPQISMGWTLIGDTIHANQTPLFTSCEASDATGAMKNPDNWYPGDDAVEWIVPDMYDGHGKKTMQEMLDYTYTWTQTCRAVHPAINYNCSTSAGNAKPKKPFGWAEWGFDADPAVNTKEYRAREIGAQTTLIKKYPNLRLLLYWGSDVFVPTGGSDYRLDMPASDNSYTVLKAYAQTALNPYVANLQLPSTPRRTGDINYDGRVNAIDLSLLLVNDMRSDFPAGDLKPDGIIDGADMAILLTNWTW